MLYFILELNNWAIWLKFKKSKVCAVYCAEFMTFHTVTLKVMKTVHTHSRYFQFLCISRQSYGSVSVLSALQTFGGSVHLDQNRKNDFAVYFRLNEYFAWSVWFPCNQPNKISGKCKWFTAGQVLFSSYYIKGNFRGALSVKSQWMSLKSSHECFHTIEQKMQDIKS